MVAVLVRAYVIPASARKEPDGVNPPRQVTTPCRNYEARRSAVIERDSRQRGSHPDGIAGGENVLEAAAVVQPDRRSVERACRQIDGPDAARAGKVQKGLHKPRSNAATSMLALNSDRQYGNIRIVIRAPFALTHCANPRSSHRKARDFCDDTEIGVAGHQPVPKSTVARLGHGLVNTWPWLARLVRSFIEHPLQELDVAWQGRSDRRMTLHAHM